MSVEQTFINVMFDEVIYSEMVLTVEIIFQTGSLIIWSSNLLEFSTKSFQC